VDLPVDEVRIHGRVAHECRRGDPREDVRHGRLRLALTKELDHALARRDELRRVGAHGELEDGRLPCLREPACNRLARRRELDDLELRLCTRRSRRPDRRLLDVLCDDAPLRPGSDDLGEIEPSLARDPPGKRARLHMLALRTYGRRLRRRRGCGLGCRLVRGGLDTRRRLLLGLRRPLRLGGRRGAAVSALCVREHTRDVLVLGSDDPHGRADVDLALPDDDLQQDAVGLRLHLLRHLVRVELVERLALRDGVALRLQPAHDRPGLHALTQARELDLRGHR
jgi:hypothetical protein